MVLDLVDDHRCLSEVEVRDSRIEPSANDTNGASALLQSFTSAINAIESCYGTHVFAYYAGLFDGCSMDTGIRPRTNENRCGLSQKRQR